VVHGYKEAFPRISGEKYLEKPMESGIIKILAGREVVFI